MPVETFYSGCSWKQDTWLLMCYRSSLLHSYAHRIRVSMSHTTAEHIKHSHLTDLPYTSFTLVGLFHLSNDLMRWESEYCVLSTECELEPSCTCAHTHTYLLIDWLSFNCLNHKFLVRKLAKVKQMYYLKSHCCFRKTSKTE